MNTFVCDVGIIGAGPAGSTLAALLASAGAAVVLVDRDVFPRDKLCGEFLSYDALPILELSGALREIDRAGATRICRCRLVGSRRVYEFELPREARGISRRAMDEILLRRAGELGAKALEGWTADSLEHHDDHAVVGVRQGERKAVVQARIVCGAWGRWGRFDLMMGREFASGDTDRNFGFKRHYTPSREGVAPPPDTIDLYSFDRGYLGVNWVEGGVTNICGLAHESRLSRHRGGWPAFVETIRKERETIERLYAGHAPAQDEFLSSEPVIFSPRSVVQDHVLLIGDAAGLIDPLAGNGMAMAIQSAALAAPRILRMLRGDLSRAEMERDWTRAHASLFAGRIRWSRRVAWLLCRPRLIDVAMTLHTPPIVGRALLERTRATAGQVEALVEGAGFTPTA